MWRWEGVKMRRCERRCEDEKVWEKMWRWEGVREDVKMRGCEDEKVWEKMWRWEGEREDVKMRRWERRCEDEIQTCTIGRTLRPDALGKNTYSHMHGCLDTPGLRLWMDMLMSICEYCLLLAWTTLFFICPFMCGATPKVRLDPVVGKYKKNFCEDWQ